MNNYNVRAYIELYPTHTISFARPLEYSASSSVKAVLDFDKDAKNKMVVSFAISTDSSEKARFLADNELFRIVNVLGWKASLPAKKFRIDSIQCVTSKGNRHETVLMEAIGLRVSLSISQSLGSESLDSLAKELSSYNPKCEDVLIMWREAISEESPYLRFILLYRLLESLNGDDRRTTDKYIADNLQKVRYQQDRNGKNITNIHISETMSTRRHRIFHTKE